MNLVTSQYRDSPNFLLWLNACLNKLDQETGVIDQLTAFFDIDSAIGAQLDILGQIIGQGRQVNFEPIDGSGSVLDDRNYRTLLKAKIVKNNWKGTLAEVNLMWRSLFPGGAIIIYDNQDMSFEVTIAGTFSLTERELVRNGYIIPKPEGVRVNYSFGDLPLFGYDLENDFIKGYDEGNWARTKEAPIFSYDKPDDDLMFRGYDKGTWDY